jgi:D-serine deaminase-like pyridoxal phosphate-dependent protein
MNLRLEQLDTPSLVIDLDRVAANLRRGADIAAAAGVALRPHTKTHKSPYFARLQVKAGAQGLTAAKVSEAEVLASAGFDDLFIANTVYGFEKGQRIRRLAGQIKLAVGVDHLEQARMLSEAMAGAPSPLGVMIEVDTGGHRGGVARPDAGALARAVAELPGLQVRGAGRHSPSAAQARLRRRGRRGMRRSRGSRRYARAIRSPRDRQDLAGNAREVRLARRPHGATPRVCAIS